LRLGAGARRRAVDNPQFGAVRGALDLLDE
jgi:hypothetical protein